MKCLSQIDNISDFVFIGQRIIDCEDRPQITFELSCRFSDGLNNSNLEINEGTELEILLKDVTRSRTNEKQKAEFKYKSLFLSKVAHEFKNPLVCIAELIHQIEDFTLFNQNIKIFPPQQKDILTNVKKILKQIKAMSDFLLVLVNDLNYFSKQQFGGENVIYKKKVKLEDIVEFCYEITLSLLKKYNKYDQVVFKINKIGIPKKIITDEWKLKQILINLLSNAVKFTLSGEISLSVCVEDKLENDFRISQKVVKFEVKDSGTGIKAGENLFKPFQKGSKVDNELGSGLGLNIVKDLTCQIGSKIQFFSTEGQGSRFWFYIPISDEELTDNLLRNSGEINKSNEIILISNKEDRGNDEKSVTTDPIDFNYFRENLTPIRIRSDLNMNSNNGSYNRSFRLNDSNNNSNKNNKEIIKNLLTKEEYFTEIFLDDLVNNNISSCLSNFTTQEGKILNIILTDDEKLSGQSSSRILKETAKTLKIFINLIILEDGVETLFAVYKLIKVGVKLDVIFSDETMNFMNGMESANLIKILTNKKQLNSIPFYLLTSYANTGVLSKSGNSIVDILSKPLLKNVAEKIFTKL